MKPERTLPKATRAALECRCTVCGLRASGEIHSADLGPFGAEWITPPAGWFVLLGVREPFMRCPDCLAAPKPTATARPSGTVPLARIALAKR